MESQAKDLFLTNYAYKGDCEGLLEFTKNFEKDFKSGTKKKISYLPWAIVERIFRLQGGKVDVVNWKLEIPFNNKQIAYDNDGVATITEKASSALFVHLHATWMGEELDEYYPVFDNQTAKSIMLPDAQDLNTARQRGSVRLIARISGIGLSAFDQQDSLDVNLPEPQDPKKVVKEPETKTTSQPEPKPKVEKKVSAPTPTPAPASDKTSAVPPTGVPKASDADFIAMMKGDVVAPEVKHDSPTDVEEYSKDSEQYAEKKLEVKRHVTSKKDVIIKFVASKGKELLGDLDYKELSELVDLLNK